jgi:hypothetical protein
MKQVKLIQFHNTTKYDITGDKPNLYQWYFLVTVDSIYYETWEDDDGDEHDEPYRSWILSDGNGITLEIVRHIEYEHTIITVDLDDDSQLYNREGGRLYVE